MLRKVLKYKIECIGETVTIDLPLGYTICDINHQNGDLYLWALVDIDAHLTPIKLLAVGTGNLILNCDNMYFMKTVHMPSGWVWHVFQVV